MIERRLDGAYLGGPIGLHVCPACGLPHELPKMPEPEGEDVSERKTWADTTAVIRQGEYDRLRAIEAAARDVMAKWDTFIVARVGARIDARPSDLAPLADALLPLRRALSEVPSDAR